MAWQDLVAVVLVLAAAGYVLRGLLQFLRRRGRSGCSCCPTCAAEDSAEALITLNRPAGPDIDADQVAQTPSAEKAESAN